LRPVAGFGAAGAGLDFDVSVAGVLLAIHHGAQFEFIETVLDVVEFLGKFRFEAGVFVGQLGEGVEILGAGVECLERLEEALRV